MGEVSGARNLTWRAQALFGQGHEGTNLAIWWQKQPANLPYKAQSSKDPVFVFCSLRELAADSGC